MRQWALKFGQGFANEIRRRLPRAGDKWHLDEIVIKIAGTTHWLWRAVDQHGIVLDVLVHTRRDAKAAERLPRKLLKRQGRAPRVMITDKLASYPAAKKDLLPAVEHRQRPLQSPRLEFLSPTTVKLTVPVCSCIGNGRLDTSAGHDQRSQDRSPPPS